MVELLVAMSVFSLAVVLAFSAVITVVRQSTQAQRSADAQSELRIALAQIDRQVRSGNVLFSPADEPTWVASCTAVGTYSGTCMRIYTQSNGTQKCVQWQLMPDPAPTATPGTYLLRSRSWAPNWQTGGTVDGWGVVARGLNYTAGVTPAPFTLSTALATGVTPYGDRLLQVHLESLDTRRDHPIAIDSSITGRNTSYGFNSGQCTPPPPA